MGGDNTLLDVTHHDDVLRAAPRVSPLTLDDLAQLKAWASACLAFAKVDEYAGAVANRVELSDEDQSYLISLLGLPEAADLLQSHVGVRKILWLVRRNHDPDLLSEESDFTERRLDALASELSSDELTALFAMAFGRESNNPTADEDPLVLGIYRGRDGCVDWPAIFRQLSRRYGWTPYQISQLTLTQMRIYLDRQ